MIDTTTIDPKDDPFHLSFVSGGGSTKQNHCDDYDGDNVVYSDDAELKKRKVSISPTSESCLKKRKISSNRVLIITQELNHSIPLKKPATKKPATKKHPMTSAKHSRQNHERKRLQCEAEKEKTNLIPRRNKQNQLLNVARIIVRGKR